MPQNEKNFLSYILTSFRLRIFFPEFKKIPSPRGEGSCEKIEIFPLTLPSPARGEGKHIENS
jgi:hypothetical protein